MNYLKFVFFVVKWPILKTKRNVNKKKEKRSEEMVCLWLWSHEYKRTVEH